MRIAAIRVTPVRVPRLRRLLPRTAHGEVNESEYVVLEVEGDGGAIGVGEVTCSPRWNGESASESQRILIERVGSAIAGRDPADWESISFAIEPMVDRRPFLRASIEMACLDLAARSVGRPAAELLGEILRTSYPTKTVLPARDPELVGEMASQVLSDGAGSLKVKVGLHSDEDLRRVGAVRAVAGPDVPLTVDANEGWDMETALKLLPGLADLAVWAIEQPLPREDWRGSALVRRKTDAMVVGDESIWTRNDLDATARHASFDTVSLYPGKCGGLRRTVAMAAAAATLGLNVSFGSNLELGIGAAALAHTMAVVPPSEPELPADLIGPLYFEATLVTDPGFVRWSGADLPAGPGLGVELDRMQLDRYTVQY